MNEHTYRRIVSGTAVGWRPTLIRGMLRILSILYSAIIRTRNQLYSRGVLPTYSAAATVISIGNLTAGGTGKTPLVIWLANMLSAKGLRCVILTRGYKSRSGTLSDEPALLAKACNGVDVIVNPDRIAGAKKAIEHHRAQVLILDDGFQHRRLKRDLDIVAVDATCPFGYEKILPAGLLREPIESLRRADVVILTRCDQAGEEQISGIEKTIQKVRPELPMIRSVHKQTAAKTYHSQQITINQLKQKKVFAFCGIGNPDAFFKSLESLGCTLVGKQLFGDHHHYAAADLETLTQKAQKCEAELILTTEKDWVKAALLVKPTNEIPLYYLVIQLEFIGPPDTMMAAIDRLTNSISGKESE